MSTAQGGCLCGALRYQVAHQPARTTICHCKFCQRATGGAYMIEPIFDTDELTVIQGTPKQYQHLSEGSGKAVNVHFCNTCGTKLFLTFERFEGIVGLYGGTLDDPDWVQITPDNAKHIFLGVARDGTYIPPHINTFIAHATKNDGTPIEPNVFDEPHKICRP